MSEGRGLAIRVTGVVQGVGFRPAVWRLARSLELSGNVRNDGDSVMIEAWGDNPRQLIQALKTSPPPLARIDEISSAPLEGQAPRGFRIVDSSVGSPPSRVLPDSATCPACLEDTLSPLSRRFRYPFTNCTHCGPRFSILSAIPYDRGHTTMADFTMCQACQAEYESPADRRFHAQPNACHACGPSLRLRRADGRPFFLDQLTPLDAADAFATLIAQGHIVAAKGLGGYHLACDATNENAVTRLRHRKRRPAKPLALMARDLDVIERYAATTPATREALLCRAAPIVLLTAEGEPVAPSVAPDSNELGFMLPSTPMHTLMFRRIDKPVVMTSGNQSGAPPAIRDDDAETRLTGVVDYFLFHDRAIANRVDDSVVRVIAGVPRVLRRARGYAPDSLPAPPGFADGPRILAMGADLKNTFCLYKDEVAVLSQHIGDLGEAAARRDYVDNLKLYGRLYENTPEIVAVDLHPDYASRAHGLALADEWGVPLTDVQHHHAHIAACMFEHRVAIDTRPILGVVLDGLGYGSDGTIWGGEFLAVTYDRFERLATFKPVGLLGGNRAMREPWRNTFAHINAELGWARYLMNFGELELTRYFADKPVDALLRMLERPELTPRATSAGRLFDAVAAAVGLHRDAISFEGQAAMALEAIADRETLDSDAVESAYPFSIPLHHGMPYLEPVAMWQALLGDLILQTPAPVISARFHKGLARAITAMVRRLVGDGAFETVALGGGVWQNAILTELVGNALRERGLRVIVPRMIPVNDGGIALGQVAVACAQALAEKRESPCA